MYRIHGVNGCTSLLQTLYLQCTHRIFKKTSVGVLLNTIITYRKESNKTLTNCSSFLLWFSGVAIQNGHVNEVRDSDLETMFGGDKVLQRFDLCLRRLHFGGHNLGVVYEMCRLRGDKR